MQNGFTVQKEINEGIKVDANILIMKMIIAVNDAAGAWVVHIVMNMMHLLMRNFRKSRREKSNDDDVYWY